MQKLQDQQNILELVNECNQLIIAIVNMQCLTQCVMVAIISCVKLNMSM